MAEVNNLNPKNEFLSFEGLTHYDEKLREHIKETNKKITPAVRVENWGENVNSFKHVVGKIQKISSFRIPFSMVLLVTFSGGQELTRTSVIEIIGEINGVEDSTFIEARYIAGLNNPYKDLNWTNYEPISIFVTEDLNAYIVINPSDIDDFAEIRILELEYQDAYLSIEFDDFGSWEDLNLSNYTTVIPSYLYLGDRSITEKNIKAIKSLTSGISEGSIQTSGNVAGIKGYRIKGFYQHHLSFEGSADGSTPGREEDWQYISFNADDTPGYPLYLNSLDALGNSYGYGATPPIEFRGIKVNWAVDSHVTIMNANNWDEACTIIAEHGDDENGYYYEVTRFPFYALWVQYTNEAGKTTTADNIIGTTIEEFNEKLNAISNKVELHDTSYCAFNIDQPDEGLIDGGWGTFAQGTDTKALLDSAAVFGYNNEALGKYSLVAGRNNTGYYGTFVAGRGNTAGADLSGAVGQSNTIHRNSRNSFSEGVRNNLYGYADHGEGVDNTIYASMGHVEGNGNIAGEAQYVGQDMNTNCVHIEGSNNTASGKESNIHIEGRGNNAKGAASHTEGSDNVNNSHFTHMEGGKNTADTGNNNAFGHVEGYSNTLTAIHGHVEGHSNVVAAEDAHGEGYNNKVYGVCGHIEGRGNTIGETGGTKPENTHVEGSGNKALGTENHIHVEGRDNTVTSACAAHAEGDANSINTGAHWSHVGGRGNTVNHEGANLHGKGLTSGANYQTVVGKYNDPKTDTLFEVGNGSSFSNKSNAFEVLTDGSIKVEDTVLTAFDLRPNGYCANLTSDSTYKIMSWEGYAFGDMEDEFALRANALIAVAFGGTDIGIYEISINNPKDSNWITWENVSLTLLFGDPKLENKLFLLATHSTGDYGNERPDFPLPGQLHLLCGNYNGCIEYKVLQSVSDFNWLNFEYYSEDYSLDAYYNTFIKNSNTFYLGKFATMKFPSKAIVLPLQATEYVIGVITVLNDSEKSCNITLDVAQNSIDGISGISCLYNIAIDNTYGNERMFFTQLAGPYDTNTASTVKVYNLLEHNSTVVITAKSFDVNTIVQINPLSINNDSGSFTADIRNHGTFEELYSDLIAIDDYSEIPLKNIYLGDTTITDTQAQILKDLAKTYSMTNGGYQFKMTSNNLNYSRNYTKENYVEKSTNTAYASDYDYGVIANKSFANLIAEDYIIKFPISLDSARFASFTYNSNWKSIAENTLTKMLCRFLDQITNASLISSQDKAYFTDLPIIVQFYAQGGYMNVTLADGSVEKRKITQKNGSSCTYALINSSQITYTNSTDSAGGEFTSQRVWEINFTVGDMDYCMRLWQNKDPFDTSQGPLNATTCYIAIYECAPKTLKLGNTELTEKQLQKILFFMDSVSYTY